MLAGPFSLKHMAALLGVAPIWPSTQSQPSVVLPDSCEGERVLCEGFSIQLFPLVCWVLWAITLPLKLHHLLCQMGMIQALRSCM